MNNPGHINISIVCCTRNRSSFVREHYAMLRDKMTSATEVLYALDHCTDDTLDYVRSIAQTDPRVRFAENTGAAGLFSCRNFAIDQVRGRYVHYLDDDDGVSDGFYARIDALLAQGVQGDMLVTTLLLDEDGHPPRFIPTIDTAKVTFTGNDDLRVVEGNIFDHVLNGHLYFYNGNTLINVDTLRRFPFHAEIRKTADWLQSLEIAHAQPVRQVHIGCVHAIYRVHANSMSIASDKSHWNMKAFELLYRSIPAGHPHSNPVKRVFARALFDAGYAIRRSDKRGALAHYLHAARMGYARRALAAVVKLPFT
jgi:glycosyltransferase involved in cell wall biosynthesis